MGKVLSQGLLQSVRSPASPGVDPAFLPLPTPSGHSDNVHPAAPPAPSSRGPLQTHLEEEAEDSQPIGMPLGLCQCLVLGIHVDNVHLRKAQRSQVCSAARSQHPGSRTFCYGSFQPAWPDSEPTPPSKALLVLWALLEDQSTPVKQAFFEGCAKGGQQSRGACQTQSINSAFLWQIMNILEAQSLFHPEGSQCA